MSGIVTTGQLVSSVVFGVNLGGRVQEKVERMRHDLQSGRIEPAQQILLVLLAGGDQPVHQLSSTGGELQSSYSPVVGVLAAADELLRDQAVDHAGQGGETETGVPGEVLPGRGAEAIKDDHDFELRHRE